MRLVAVILLALMSLVLSTQPVNAHNYDAASFWYCAKHRPSSTTVPHSWPYLLGPGFVGYWCRAQSIYSRASWQYWVWVLPPGSPNSARPYEYQQCNPGGIVWCGTTGH